VNRFFRLVMTVLSATVVVSACAPGAKTVANVSIGNTGCPAEDLAVFNYTVENRSWRALCVNKLYVCSDTRGATQCVPQDPNTEEAGLRDRAQLLLKLDRSRRDLFIKSDIRTGSWEAYSSAIVAVSRMNQTQLADVEDGMRVVAGLSDGFMKQLSACQSGVILPIRVDKAGALIPNAGPKTGCFFKLMGSAELAPLRAHKGQKFFVPTGIPGVKPLPHPQAAPAPVAPPPAPVEEPAPAASPEMENAVRQWLDSNAKAVLSCTGEETSVVVVQIDAQGAPQLTLQGPLAGKPAEGCIRAALGTQQFDPGPAELMHLVKKPPPKKK
jgi:hypothetical protein